MSAAAIRGALAAGVVFQVLGPASLAQSETLKIKPGIDVTETYSDNIDQGLTTESRGGWITNVSPTLRIDLAGARAKGFLDFRYYDLRYQGEPQLDNAQKFLDSRLAIEAIEKWLYVDARAEISQQNRSPYGAASDPTSPTVNPNRIESRIFQLSPVIRGRLLDSARYAVRYTASELRTDDLLVPESRSSESSARLQSDSAGRRVNWVLEASDIAIRNDVVGKQNDSRVRATLIYEWVPSLRLSVSGGYEKTDFVAPEDEKQTSPGAGFAWIPSERTQLLAFAERRFFGTGHSLSFLHRTAYTAWRVSSVKDASVVPLGISASGTGSIGGLVTYMLTSAIPDPEAREAAARQRLEEFGVPSGSFVSSGVVTNRPSVYRNSEAGVTIQGGRHFFSLGLADREERFSQADPGALAGFNDNRRRSYYGSLSRRLTPQTTLTAFGGAQRTEALQVDGIDSRQSDYGLQLTTRLGRVLAVSLGVRRTKFDSTLATGDYRENAVFLTLTARS